jgi:predicted molibdopterin-dependent oxidoreductase YjgC
MTLESSKYYQILPYLRRENQLEGCCPLGGQMQSQGACDISILNESIDGLRAGASAIETSDMIDISYQTWHVPLEYPNILASITTSVNGLVRFLHKPKCKCAA